MRVLPTTKTTVHSFLVGYITSACVLYLDFLNRLNTLTLAPEGSLTSGSTGEPEAKSADKPPEASYA